MMFRSVVKSEINNNKVAQSDNRNLVVAMSLVYHVMRLNSRCTVRLSKLYEYII